MIRLLIVAAFAIVPDVAVELAENALPNKKGLVGKDFGNDGPQYVPDKGAGLVGKDSIPIIPLRRLRGAA
eukprot:CAMPEP_0119261392 /NCGR_PEP_ID=MMETSP1329-20130426/1479_1 /TAXON_ID=114041 /ORGANISM="Genus nov. species nov., Strain RCC1024" /LENGTH=69 /DNA_ID=CAMNT_0007260949 /DNA_START=18 /DNA_END=227 /DNA_ORIENTATION=-